MGRAAYYLEEVLKELTHLSEVGKQWSEYAFRLEDENGKLRQERDKMFCQDCPRSLKRLVGAPGIEPGTTTMSRSGCQEDSKT